MCRILVTGAAYTHCELNKALSIGYVVTDVFEVSTLEF